MSLHFESLANDTIVAQATPAGRGGVAILRISGPKVKNLIAEILTKELKPRQAHCLNFYDENQEVLDQGIAIFFPQPNSFTGEDVLELHAHGGPVVVDQLLQRIINVGVRLARPGEFSERAFLNGKLDLAQAEAIADLINASSKQAARSAIRSLQGDFSKDIQHINQHIIHLRMYVEAAIDFSDEKIDFLNDHTVLQLLEKIQHEFATILTKTTQGAFLREGIQAVIVGAPNVGKSSLLNALTGKECAIVTDIPGTTRDVLRESILIDGMPMHVIDTAGLRESNDIVEQEGIRRAYQEIEQADIVLCVCDIRNPLKEEFHFLSPHALSKPTVFIYNKIDLMAKEPSLSSENQQTVIKLSAKTGAGLELLREHIKQMVGFQSQAEGIYLARRRHCDALKRAQEHIESAVHHLKTVHAGELAAEDLRLAHQALGEITGEFTADDLLGQIFANFCIGK